MEGWRQMLEIEEERAESKQKGEREVNPYGEKRVAPVSIDISQ
jgi:hypothetical protein